MYIRNTTDADIVLSLDTVPYRFPPSNPPAPPPLPPKKGKDGKDEEPAAVAPPPAKSAVKVKPQVVRCDDHAAGHHFISRTMQPIPRHSAGHHPGATFGLVEYIPRPGEDFEVVAVFFPKRLPRADNPESASIHSFTARKPGDPQPQMKPEVVMDVKKHNIATLHFDTLKKVAVKRNLMKDRDRIDKPSLVDKLYNDGWDPDPTATRS